MITKHKYFPVNDVQRQWGLYATCVGHSQTNPGDNFPSYRKNTAISPP